MLGCLAGGSLDLLVALVTDQQDVVIVASETLGLLVHLGDQRTGGVDGLEAAGGSRPMHLWRHPVCGEDDDRTLRDLVGLADEHGATLGERVDDVPVVNDLFAHVDGCSVLVQGAFDGLDRTVDARAVTARLGQQDTLWFRHGLQGTWCQPSEPPRFGLV